MLAFMFASALLNQVCICILSACFRKKIFLNVHLEGWGWVFKFVAFQHVLCGKSRRDEKTCLKRVKV